MIGYIDIEQWLPAKGLKGYLVSSHGRIMSVKTGIIRKPFVRKGYYCITFTGGKKVNVHRIVAGTFLGEFNGVINHKDENTLNNRVENLEWCTHKYNSCYGTCKKRAKESRIRNGNTTKVMQLTLDGVPIGSFSTYYDAANAIGKKNGAANICGCCKGRKKSAYGFIWKYGKEAA